MSGSNYTHEIKQAMQSKSKAKPPVKGKPPTAGSRDHDGPVAKSVPPPHKATSPAPQPPMPHDPPPVHGVEGATQFQQGGGGGSSGHLMQAHQQLVHALMQRDRGM